MATTAKRKLVIEKTMKSIKGSEVSLNPMTYTLDLMKALNYYNVNYKDADFKKWFLSSYSKIDKKLAPKLNKLPDYHFKYLGILSRLVETGSILEEQEQTYYDEKLKYVLNLVQIQDEQEAIDNKTKPQAAVVSIQERIEDKSKGYIGDIEGAIDSFIESGEEFSIKGFLTSNNVSSVVSKKIQEHFSSKLPELKEAYSGKDAILKEGYSNFKKSKLKQLITFIEDIVTGCQQQTQSVKVARKPRVSKPASAAKLIQSFKYSKENPELSLKSVNPTSIIDSKECWVYDSKRRVVTVYKAETTLSVKGSSIVGFSVSESKSFKLRDPSKFFTGLSLTKRNLANALKQLTTKPSVPGGRTNEEVIILGAFK